MALEQHRQPYLSGEESVMTDDKSSAEGLAGFLRDEAEYAEQHKDDPYPPGATATQPGKARSVVYSVRLAPEEVAALERFAAAAGLPASTLVRSWIVTNTSGRVENLRQLVHDEVREAVREALATK